MQKGQVPILILVGILVIAVIAAGAYYFGKSSVKLPVLQPQVVASPTLQPTRTDETVNWKTYTSNNMKFSLQYLQKWIVQEGGKDCPIFSDIPNPRATSASVLKNGHTYIEVCFIPEDMPSTLPYAIKDTIKLFFINNYSGLRGKEIFVLPGGIEGENVYLQNPNGGYVTFGLHVGDVQTFDKMIASFKFIDQNQGKIKIIDGNVYFISENGKQQILADKEDFEWSLKFTNAVLSPDQSKVLLLAQGSISSELLFYTAVDNVNVKKIYTADEAVWSHNSRYIAYNSKVADAGRAYILNIYDTNLDKNLSLTQQPDIQGALAYSNIQWQPDDLGVKVHYIAQSDVPHGDILGEGDLVIPLTSFAFQ